jgi:hypothetical protein
MDTTITGHHLLFEYAPESVSFSPGFEAREIASAGC